MAPHMRKFWLFPSGLPGAVTAADILPDLYPPEELVKPTFWEQYGSLMALAGLVMLALGWFIFLWLRRPRPVVEEPPAIRARRVLQELSLKPEDGEVAGQVSRTVRKYLLSAAALPPGELTSEEIAWRLQQDESFEQELRLKTVELLRQCDAVKFSTVPPRSPANLAARALALVDKIEARREAARMRKQAEQAAPPAARAAL